MRRIWVILIAALVIIVGAGIGIASIPDANGVIHGCYKASDGKLRVVDSTCATGETSLDWNQTGPAGPPGVSGYEIVTTDQVVGANPATVSATCPTGKNVLGGGVWNESLQGGTSPNAPVNSYPSTDGGAWIGSGIRWAELYDLHVYAICAFVG